MSEPEEAQEGEEEDKEGIPWDQVGIGCGIFLFFIAMVVGGQTSYRTLSNIIIFIAGVAFFLGVATFIYRNFGVKGFVVGFLIWFVFDEQQARINCGPFLNKNGMMGLMFKASYPIEGDCRLFDLYPPLTISFTEPILIKLGLIRPVNIFDPRNMTGE
jgi:hypothetical protein